MRKRLLVSISLAALLLLILPGQISYATPTPPYVLINESTRESAITILGDECMWCEPPQGWKILDMNAPSNGTHSCPVGFTKIDKLELNCTLSKTPFCCGVFSSLGDCEDMIVNATQQACAFVSDINTCILPEGWSKRPRDIPESSWSCNYSSHWVEDVACLTAPPTLAPLLKRNIPVPRLGFSTGDRPWADFAGRRGTDLVVEKACQSLKPSPSRRWRWGRQVYDRKVLPFGLKPGLASFTASSTLESTGSSRTLAIFEARRTLAIFEAQVLGEEVLVVFQVLYSPHFLRFSRSKKGKIYFNL